MIRVKLSTNFPEWPLVRQTPGSRGRWGECEFLVNQTVSACDFWVVYEGVTVGERTVCPPGNLVLVTGEPPSIKRYAPGFLAQFATVLTCHTALSHERAILGQQAQPWHLGVSRGHGGSAVSRLDFDALEALAPREKPRLISVICSSKAITAGHRLRLEFVQRLKSHWGPTVDVYGRGFTPIDDKAHAIVPHKYHVVLENEQLAHYWTEKLADAFLGGAYPLYHGCPNLSEYFPAGSFTAIDIAETERAIGTIQSVIEAGAYEQARGDLEIARARVLREFNLFAVLAGLCRVRSAVAPTPVRIRPESDFTKRSLGGRASDIARGAIRAVSRPLRRAHR